MPARFTEVARRRPIAIVQPGTRLPAAPYAAVEADLDPARPTGRVTLWLDDVELAAACDGRVLSLEVVGDGGRQRHRSRRHGAVRRPDALALSLPGPTLTGWVRETGRWVARAQVDLSQTPTVARSGRVDVHDPARLAGLRADGERSGVFGQLGLRDLRVVTEADGTAYDAGPGRVLLTATSAGPAGFRTAHASVWELDTESLRLTHRGDLFARRRGPRGRLGVYGDHAVHLLRGPGPEPGRPGGWLLAGSTWGDFDRRHQHVGATLARVDAERDPLRGTHVLGAEPFELPTTGLTSVGVWDPHLVRVADGSWLVAYVSATRFFAFHPVLAAGPTLDALTLRGAAADRTFTEGPVLVRGAAASGRSDDAWLLAASDGRAGRRVHPIGYPLFSTAPSAAPPSAPQGAPSAVPALHRVGRIDAAYPTNLPWPTLLDVPVDPPAGPGSARLLIGFDGSTAGGRLCGYGTHGDVVIQREVGAATRTDRTVR